MLHPLSEGPFYAVRIICPIFGTYNGIKVNGHFQMLNAEGHVVSPGLFVGGQDNAGLFSFPYTEYNGSTMCNALAGGMLIAEHASEYVKEQQT